MTWLEFRELSNAEYENTDKIMVNSNLFVVGEDFWLERNNSVAFDGYYEWWEYKSLPIMPSIHAEIEIFNN